MKFVIGLLAGAVVTLLGATVLNAELREDLSAALPPLSLNSAAAVRRVDPAAFTEFARSEPAAPETAAPLDAAPEPIKSVTIAPLPPPVEPQRLPDPAPPLPSLAPREPSLAAPSPVAKAAAAHQEPGTRKSDAARSEPSTAVVWKPFHSEVSAKGFARRLSVQLGYPFRSLREGPARYHVVFDYESVSQRELLREQVKALTGFSVI